MQQVDPLSGEGAQLAEAEAGERRGEHERSKAGLDRVGDLVDLVDGGDRSLRRLLNAGTLDHARFFTSSSSITAVLKIVRRGR